MSSTEWFRRTSWTEDDAAEFAARLARSRSRFHKAQYLRIQAGHLLNVGTRPLTEVSLALLDQLLAQFPEPSELSLAHMQRAECLRALGKPEEALSEYEESLALRRTHPKWGNQAWLAFAELVVSLRRQPLYDSALAVLDEFSAEAIFPIDQFRMFVVRALVADERHDAHAAREWAQRALAMTSVKASPFRFHRKIGLVHDVDRDLLARLERLAA